MRPADLRSSKRRLGALLTAAGLALGLPMLAFAQTEDDPVRLEGSTIRGDQELPSGLYITPWRDSQPEQGIDKPARLLDEALVPIDPDAFRRQMLYWQALEAARPKPESAPE